MIKTPWNNPEDTHLEACPVSGAIHPLSPGHLWRWSAADGQVPSGPGGSCGHCLLLLLASMVVRNWIWQLKNVEIGWNWQFCGVKVIWPSSIRSSPVKWMNLGWFMLIWKVEIPPKWPLNTTNWCTIFRQTHIVCFPPFSGVSAPKWLNIVQGLKPWEVSDMKYMADLSGLSWEISLSW